MFPALLEAPLWPQLVEFFGRVHPLLVHFPIALILVAGAVEFLGSRRAERHPTDGTLLCLSLGALGAALSAWSGWTWAAHEDLGRSVARTLFLHRWSGVSLAALSALSALLAWAVRWKGVERGVERGVEERGALAGVLYRATLLFAVLAVAVTGHLGGKLVHGDILEVFASDDAAQPEAARDGAGDGPGDAEPEAGAAPPADLLAPDAGPGTAPSATEPLAPDPAPAGDASAPVAARVDFAREVRPILAGRCYECHGEKKKKAGLRFDLIEEVFLGEPEGWVIRPGDAAASPLYQRITLPDEDPDRMPSKGDPLDAAQIALIRAWIDQGAHLSEEGAEEAGDEPPGATAVETGGAAGPAPSGSGPSAPPGRETGATTVAADPAAPAEPPPVLTAAGEAALEALARRGALAAPLAAGSTLVEASFALLGAEVTDADLALLAGLEPNLVGLDLSRTQVSDAGLARLAAFPRLQRLKLCATDIGDAGLAPLARLARLEVLNLYATRVTDAGLEHLAGLRALRRLYLWQTAVTDEGLARLRAELPELVVVGDELASLAAVAAALEAQQAAASYRVPCCESSAEKGEECAHPCCVEARAAGTLCPTCQVEVAAAEGEGAEDEE